MRRDQRLHQLDHLLADHARGNRSDGVEEQKRADDRHDPLENGIGQDRIGGREVIRDEHDEARRNGRADREQDGENKVEDDPDDEKRNDRQNACNQLGPDIQAGTLVFAQRPTLCAALWRATPFGAYDNLPALQVSCKWRFNACPS